MNVHGQLFSQTLCAPKSALSRASSFTGPRLVSRCRRTQGPWWSDSMGFDLLEILYPGLPSTLLVFEERILRVNSERLSCNAPTSVSILREMRQTEHLAAGYSD